MSLLQDDQLPTSSKCIIVYITTEADLNPRTGTLPHFVENDILECLEGNGNKRWDVLCIVLE